MKNTRITRVKANTFWNIVSYFVRTAFEFIIRTAFIRILGKDILGLNGLLTNLLSMLSIADLGISSAIGYSLYKPLAKNNQKQISAIMSFFRKAYLVIGVMIFLTGILLAPLLPLIIKDISNFSSVYIIYLLFLINTSLTYIISYKETLIIADQKNYLILKRQILIDLLSYTIQLVVLFLAKNYIVFLSVQIITQLLQKSYINRFIGQHYQLINFRIKDKLPLDTKRELKTNIKALFMHKLGDYFINGTDNILISAFIAIETVGIYSNYTLIISAIIAIISLIYGSILSSIGNMIATEDKNKQYEAYRKVDFMSFLIISYCTVMLISLLNPFIEIWAGDGYLIDGVTSVFIVINFYLTCMRIPTNTYKNAAGLYRNDQYTPLIQSFVNIVTSIILAKHIGLLGVILGTTISSLVLPTWQRPIIVFRDIFQKNPAIYFKRHLGYALTVITISSITCLIRPYLNNFTPILNLIAIFLTSTFVYAGVIFLLYHKDDGFSSVKKILLDNRSIYQ